MDNMEKEPGELVAGESLPENLPETVGPPAPETEVVVAGFTESAEMIAIRNRVEKGEELTVELYTAYQVAGEAIVESLSGDEQNITNLYMQLACAKLLANGGLKAEALEAINELADEQPNTGFYALFFFRALGIAECIHRELTTTTGKLSIINFEWEISVGTKVPITIDGYELELGVQDIDDLGNVTLCLFIPEHKYARKLVTISREGNVFDNEDPRFKSHGPPDFDKSDNEPVFQSSELEIAQQMADALSSSGSKELSASEREPIPQDETRNKRPMNVGEVEDDFQASLEAAALEEANPENPDAS